MVRQNEMYPTKSDFLREGKRVISQSVYKFKFLTGLYNRFFCKEKMAWDVI